ncbi:MAG TPA: glycine--tRNA ligase subunit beta [Burkholderiales bacterium]|nr:glycine--tRNA ligase subunit beta [Burkholderiales bacterium]
MSSTTLLVEIRTEELPPKALARLGRAFADALAADLKRDDFLGPDSTTRWYATPRRLAVQIANTLDVAPDREVEVAGPSVKAGLDAEGKPTQALLGFARKNNVAVEALQQRDTPKGRAFYYRAQQKGSDLASQLAGKVAAALKGLPIPKVMRWGAGDAEFVRPVHGLVMMHGDRVVQGSVLGIESGNTTLGHRFLSEGPVIVANAGDYESVLRDRGSVIASFDARKAAIREALQKQAGGKGALLDDEALLDEVSALVEFPVVYEGGFSADFLDVPQECLILSMKQHQKYFPLVAKDTQKLLPRFLVVSNLKTDDPANIVRGNERVLRARLADAKFFYDQDRKVRLEERVPQLGAVVYHNRLGSQLERIERVQLLAGKYARALDADAALAERGAWLAKADLVTGMVGEFPELQGIMGRYYALHDGEPALVADAVEGHYHPRFAGDSLPESREACAVALADKLEALAGLFGIGQQPTGDKDPYALRRQALGVIRILSERALPLSLTVIVRDAFGAFDPKLKVKPAEAELLAFFHDRMRGYFVDAGYGATEVDAVLALKPDRVDLIRLQLDAVTMFNTLPEAPSLAAANKRIGNILKKAERVPADFRAELLVEAPEKTLAQEFGQAKARADAHYERQDYAGMLKTLAALKEPVDAFFDGVMVMADDVKLRDNRIALLAQLRDTMNRIADISRLAV